MKIVGLDLSYTATGIALVGRGKPKTLLVRPPGPDKATWGRRVEEVLQACLCWAEFGDRVVIEGAAWNQITSAFRLGKLCGVVEYELHRAGIPYEYVPSTRIKKFATGNGRASKEEMVKAAQQFLPELEDHNEADALHIALWGLDKYAK